MKKILSLTLALAMLGTVLTGCGSKDAASQIPAEGTQQTAPVQQEQRQTEKALALINTFATGDTDTARSLLSDGYIQHNTSIADGVSGLNTALGVLAEQGISMVYDEVHMVLAQGNFVLAVSEGTFGDTPTSYYDLWRVENGKIAEHWDVMETIADQSTWQNQNGKF